MKYIKLILPIFALLLFSQTNLDAQRRGPFGAFPQKKVDVFGPLAVKQVNDRRTLVATYTSKPATIDSMFNALFKDYEGLVTAAITTAGADWEKVWDLRNNKSQKKARFAEQYRIKIKVRKGYDSGLVAAMEKAVNTTYINTFKQQQVALGAVAARAIAIKAAQAEVIAYILKNERSYLQSIIDKG